MHNSFASPFFSAKYGQLIFVISAMYENCHKTDSRADVGSMTHLFLSSKHSAFPRAQQHAEKQTNAQQHAEEGHLDVTCGIKWQQQKIWKFFCGKLSLSLSCFVGKEKVEKFLDWHSKRENSTRTRRRAKEWNIKEDYLVSFACRIVITIIIIVSCLLMERRCVRVFKEYNLYFSNCRDDTNSLLLLGIRWRNCLTIHF